MVGGLRFWLKLVVSVITITFVAAEGREGEDIESDSPRSMPSSSMGTGKRISRRRDSPLNVTSAFSDVHVRFVALKTERTVDKFNGILKFEPAAESKRGIPDPIVAAVNEPPLPLDLTLEFVQALSAATVQLEPVNPLEQTHRHALPETRLVPPFWHGEVFAQSERFGVLESC